MIRKIGKIDIDEKEAWLIKGVVAVLREGGGGGGRRQELVDS